jgi:hypothetical protein
MKIDDLFEIESDPKILDYRFKTPDIPMWLPIRFQFYYDIVKRVNSLENPHVKVNPYKLLIKKKIDYITKSIFKHPFRGKKVDILIFGAGINNAFENNKFYNRLYDPLFDIFNSIALIESSNKFSYPTPRYLNDIFYEDLVLIIAKLISKFKSFQEQDKDTIIRFIEYLKTRLIHLNLPNFVKIESYYTALQKLSINFQIRAGLYHNILSKFSPKVIMVEDGHYFGRIDLILSAKKMGIKVAEYQHGFINSNHFAYNFHLNLLDKIKLYTPDYMLFWGEYWSKNCNTPSKKTVVGFPYLSVKSKDVEERKKGNLKVILLCSGGNIPENYNNFGLLLTNKLGKQDYIYIFRPHPSERSESEKRYSQLLNAGYALDMGNLYDTLKSVDIFISLEATTVLFEAINFCNKVILLKTDASDLFLNYNDKELPFFVANNEIELLQHIMSEQEITKEKRTAFFYPNYEEAFQNWYEGVLK